MGVQLKAGGKFHLKLNTGERPIANKYCEGKVKRTLFVGSEKSPETKYLHTIELVKNLFGVPFA